MARTFMVHQRTHFLGQIKDPRPLILASRATILPSNHEGLSRAVMESACLGVPIIGADARGIRDIVQPRRGLVYPTGDVIALRDAILQMCEDPSPQIVPDPDWRIENIIRLHEDLYRGLLEEVVNEETPAENAPAEGQEELREAEAVPESDPAGNGAGAV
jgi:glycosyltransferase involved in cell wall biosynthesis